MNKRKVTAICMTVFALSGCAVVPPESVKLSSTIGQQMLEIKKSHVNYVNLYYERMESQANRAVDQIYAPELISTALNGNSGRVLLERLEAGKKGGAEAQDAIQFATRFLTLVRNSVEKRRENDLQPIRDARKAALANIEGAWAQAVQGNATITGYLSSLVKIREAQDSLFSAIGLPDQDKIGEKIANASDKIDGLLTEAKDKDANLADLKKQLEEIRNSLKRN